MHEALLIFGLLACMNPGHRAQLSKAAHSAAAAFRPNLRAVPFHLRHPTYITAPLWAGPPMMVAAPRSFAPASGGLNGAKCSRKQALAAFVSCVFMGSPDASLAATLDPGTTLRSLQQQERTVEDLFTQAAPSVVFISTFKQGMDRFTMDPAEVREGTGSGFVWDNDGHIVTNYHVVRGFKDVTVAVIQDVTVAVKKMFLFNASLVGYNPDEDIAILQIDKNNMSAALSLTPIPIGSSENLRVGATTLAIGNPFGLDHTLTVGVVSGVGREMRSISGTPIRDLIQTDAAFNPGSSGGALLDSSGKLIGMPTAIYSRSGTSAGVGFAIPVETIKQQADILIRDGKVVRASLGVGILQASPTRALGIERGVLVTNVKPNSNAAKAGLRGGIRGGDVIVKLDDKSIDEANELYKALKDYTPGQEVKLTVSRLQVTPDGLEETETDLSITLQALEVK